MYSSNFPKLVITTVVILFFLFSQYCNAHPIHFISGDINGTVWLDSDSNNILSPNDLKIEGVRVELFLSNDILIQFQHTDSDGRFTFSDIPNGEYYLKFETIKGLVPVNQNIQNDLVDSDISMDGMSDFFIHSEFSNSAVDAGFESSLYVITDNIIETCKGMDIEIELSSMSFGDDLVYMWEHDDQLTSNKANITANETKVYTVTITDEWNMPVVKEILVKVQEGIGEEYCEVLDPLTEGENSSFSLDISGANPGPVHIQEAAVSAFGGYRDITFELVEGSNTSSVNIDYSESLLSISNGNGCRTKTSICYDGGSSNTVLTLTAYSYVKMIDILLDQGRIQASFLLTDITDQSANYSIDIESQGFNKIFDEEINLSSFSNIQNLDLANVKEVCIVLETMNTAIDFEAKFSSFCGARSCLPSATADQEICEGEMASLEGIVDCTDNVIYNWSNGLGFGKTKTVTPAATTTYIVSVYDLNGCSSTAETTVTVNNKPSIELLSSKTTICEGETVTIEVNHLVGNGPYTYLWNNGSTQQEISVNPDNDSTYSVTVTDVNNCSIPESVLIKVNPAAILTMQTTPSNCAVFNGTASVDVNGGSPPFSYLWSNGDTSADISNQPPGSLEIQVTDSQLCVFSETVNIPSLNCAEIGDFVWHDINANGIQEIDEPALKDVMVILKDQNQQHLDTLFTDVNGYYLFTPLDAGQYFVQFETPDDFIPTVLMSGSDSEKDSDVNPMTGMTEIIPLAAGQTIENIDAGFYQFAKLGNYVWHDSDRDGSQDVDEIGIAGIQVTLHSCNGVELQTSFTNSVGKYNFCDLIPGEYYLSFDSIPGFAVTENNLVADNLDSDIDPLSMITECITLSSGEVDTLWDAGYYELAKLGDFVWIDQDLDGIQDSFELPLAGVEVLLYTCDTILLDSIVTDSLGAYNFCDLEPGPYQLYFPLVDGYEYTESIDTTDLSIDSDVEVDGFTECIMLDEGEKDTITDAGYYRLSSLGDWVWLDLNVNGIQDTDEEGIEGVKLYLFNCNNEKLDSTYTDSDGYYLFDDLQPDYYKVGLDNTSTYLITLLNQANEYDNSDLDPMTGFTECLDLRDGVDYRDLDIGLYNFSKLGDYVWYDTNGNGIQDNGESGVLGVEVALKNCTSGIVTITSTDNEGYYCFDNLLPDNYEIQFSVDYPLVFAYQNEGINENIDSDADPLFGIIPCFNLPPSTEKTDLDLGVHECSKIGDFVWFDAIENDIQDPSENGVNGININLYRLENNQWEFVTSTISQHKPGTNSDDGWWEFCVVPGQYYIEAESIDGITFVSPDQGNNEALDSDITGFFGPGTSDAFEVLSLEDMLGVDIGLKTTSVDDENSGSFKAFIDAIPGANILKWESDDEDNAEFYRILKQRPNSGEFDILIDKETKKEIINKYEYEDINTKENGLYNYQIKMFDNLNEILDAKELSVLVENTSELYIFPNPVRSTLNVVFSGIENDIISIDIMDAKGSTIGHTLMLKLEATKMYTVDIDTEAFASGVYYLRVNKNDITTTRKFLKIN